MMMMMMMIMMMIMIMMRWRRRRWRILPSDHEPQAEDETKLTVVWLL